MSLDRPRNSDDPVYGNRTITGKVPVISPDDPLPVRQPEGDWFEPWHDLTDLWRVNRRRPLSREQRDADLVTQLTATTKDQLQEKMAAQDELARQVAEESAILPASHHRNTA